MPTTFNLRTVLWAALAMALLMNYVQWQADYPPVAPPPAAAAATPAPGSAGSLDSSVPTLANAAPAASGTATQAAPAQPAASPGAAGPPATALPGQLPSDAGGIAAGPVVHVRTDVLDVDIALKGGELARADLLAYPQVKGESKPVRLLNRDSAQSLFVLQSGFVPGEGANLPNHLSDYHADSGEYRLQPGSDELSVPLTWTDGHGVTVTKTYVFRRGHYDVGLDQQLHNGGATPLRFAPYAQLLRYNEPVSTSYFHPESYAYKGPAYDDGQKYQKLKLGKETPQLDRDITGGWLAALQHHFVAAIVPPAGEAWHYRLAVQGNEYRLQATGAAREVAPGADAQVDAALFVGPKLQRQLEATSKRLYLVTDYGWLSVVAQPLFWLLEHIQRLVGNWGFTIVVATLLLKLLFYPLTEASMRSMARMKALQPRIKQLQETYKDERDKLGKAMMELYQREKVNPLAGCLPMLVQFPVFIAFYWVLLESVEMRQAPFIGWISDLSAKDPLFILPALMAIANYVNFKLNPQMGDPAQQKMMMIMQLGMPIMFAFMPSGLVLYWTTNTGLSILQQWNINRRILSAQAARN